MSMRDIYLGCSLSFQNKEEQEHSEDILMWLLGTISRLNLLYLKRHPSTPLLYNSGVYYVPPDQVSRPPIDKAKLQELFKLLQSMGLDAESGLQIYRIVRGVEVFLDVPGLYRRGKGDCNELAPVRVAELWRAGIAASPYLTKAPKGGPGDGISYHALVKWPDGSSEDPSLLLGMGGPSRAAERAEEIRKNNERYANYMGAAHILMETEGAPPEVLGRQIDLMGLLPKDGVFR